MHLQAIRACGEDFDPVFLQLPANTVRAIAGNMMSLPQVGTALMNVFASPNPGSSLHFVRVLIVPVDRRWD